MGLRGHSCDPQCLRTVNIDWEMLVGSLRAQLLLQLLLQRQAGGGRREALTPRPHQGAGAGPFLLGLSQNKKSVYGSLKIALEDC